MNKYVVEFVTCFEGVMRDQPYCEHVQRIIEWLDDQKFVYRIEYERLPYTFWIDYGCNIEGWTTMICLDDIPAVHFRLRFGWAPTPEQFVENGYHFADSREDECDD